MHFCALQLWLNLIRVLPEATGYDAPSFLLSSSPEMNTALRIATIVTMSRPDACVSGVLLAELLLKVAEIGFRSSNR
jgi:hypothetical protein